jgi:general secretion pathway protein J
MIRTLPCRSQWRGARPRRRGTQVPAAGRGLGRRGERGFTLLETLVTLVVLGFLMVTLTQGVRVGLQAWVTQGRIGGRASGIDTTDRALRQLIGRASPGETLSRDAAFTGTANMLSFTTTLPQGFGAVATHEADVTLLVADDHHLELRWRPHYRRWIVAPPPASTITLLDDVERLELAFWQPGTGSGAGGWVSAWTARDLPRLVRLRIVFPPDDPRHWPDIVIAPVRELPQS